MPRVICIDDTPIAIIEILPGLPGSIQCPVDHPVLRVPIDGDSNVATSIEVSHEEAEAIRQGRWVRSVQEAIQTTLGYRQND